MIRLVLLIMALGGQSPWGLAAAESYLSRLQGTTIQARTNLAALSRTAESAAREFLAGGNLWAAGRQPDFISEACGRAGGLMAINALGQNVPKSHDIILYAVPGALKEDDLRAFKRWREQGATVIPFLSLAGTYAEQFPVDTVANTIDLWTWTGEFVGACTRLGAMPVLYLSYGLPGGPERGRKYRGKRIHDDLSIPPVACGVLGGEYLDQMERMLARISAQAPKISEAARWWAEAKSATTMVTGHMFPLHGQDPRAPAEGGFLAVPAWENKNLLDTNHPPTFVLYLGYQFAPGKLIDQARVLGTKLAYCDVQPANPPEPAAHILYLDPAWPLTDGCVKVPKYDIPILPLSGVAQAAVYWAIASERNRPGR